MSDTEPTIIGGSARVPVEAPLSAEYGLPVRDLLGVIRRRLWIIVLSAVLLAGATVGFSLLQVPMYEASIKVMIGQERTENAVSNLGSDVQGLQQLTQTMAEAVNTYPVAEAVIRRLDLQISSEDFLENLSAEPVGGTQFIEISYEHANPEQAQRIVNAVGDEFSDLVSEVNPTTNAVGATVWEQAVTPDDPVSPKPLRNGLVALMVGAMLGVALVFLFDHLDDSWRSPEEAEQISGVPTLGVIPSFDQRNKAKKGAH